MQKKCHLLVCLFALSPPEEKKRRQVKKLEEGVGGSVVQEKEGRGREIGRNGELLTEEEREGGTTWKNRPVTSGQQACIGVSAMGVHWYHQSHCLISNKYIQFYTDFYRSHPIFHSVFLQRLLFFCHTFPNYMYVTCLIASNPLWLT